MPTNNPNIKLLNTGIQATSWKTKPDEEYAYVSEKECPIQREEGKRSRSLYTHMPRNIYAHYENPNLVECCCQDISRGTAWTPTCPFFQGLKKVKTNGKLAVTVQCSAVTTKEE